MSNSNIAVFHLTFSRSLSSCTARSLFAFARTTMRCDAMVHLQETDGRSWSEWKDNNTVNALSHWMEPLDWIDGWIVSSADGLPLKSSVGRSVSVMLFIGQEFTYSDMANKCTAKFYLQPFSCIWLTYERHALPVCHYPLPVHSFILQPRIGSDRIGSTGGGRRKTGNNTTRKLVGHLRFTITGTLWRRELEEWTGWPIQVQQRLTSVYEGNLEDIVMRS